MWQTSGGAKQSTRRGGPSLTEHSQTEHERLRSVVYIYIFLHKAYIRLLKRRRRSKPYDHILQLSTITCGHNKKLQRYCANFPSLSSTNCDFELTLTLAINTDFLSVSKVPSISTEELVFLRHARCVPSRFRCKEHSLLLSFYQFIIGKIENPSGSASRHSSQDFFHLILHCPTADSLRRSLFDDSLTLYDLWSRPLEVARILGLDGLPPCRHPSEGIK